MGHRRLGNILTYALLGLVVFFVSEAHSRRDGKSSQSASSAVDLTLTLNWGQRLTITFPQKVFGMIVDGLCSDGHSAFLFETNYVHGLYGPLPTTISSDSDQVSTWRLTISYENNYEWYPDIQYKLTWHNSKDCDLKCWNKKNPRILEEIPSCGSKPQRVYLGGSRWLVIDDKAEVVTYEYDYDNTDCNYVGCMDDCGTTLTPPKTTTPPTVDSTENNMVNITGNNTDIFVGNITNIIMGNETETTGTASPQTESSSDQTPVIVGVVIAVLVVLILIAILAVMLWRRKKSKQEEANPTFAASNPGAYADAEFIHAGNAQSQATEGGDSRSVSRQPPPYSEVERSPQHGFTNDGYGVSGDVQI